MDSVTQFVLGAAVGEAILNNPKVAGENKERPFVLGAFCLGGLVGTLPDLDVLFRRFLTGPQALGFHRGVTHSVFFCTLATPILAWVLQRIFRNREVTWGQWNVFVWLGLNTHWMIDSLTTYGTQVFLPFTNHPVNIGSVFIIDPLYTIPLLIGLLWTLASGLGKGHYRASGVRLSLALSSVYLLLTLGSKYVVTQRFETSLAEHGISYQQFISVPTPFNSILWYGYADTGEEVWVADSSLFDSQTRSITWQRIPKNRQLLEDFDSGVAGRRLLWFSRGFYRLDQVDGQPIFIDLRFARLKSWLLPISAEGNDYTFRYALKPKTLRGPYNDFQGIGPEGGFDQFPWSVLWRRVWGLEPVFEDRRFPDGRPNRVR